ncbi:hypothetical protein [Sphingomonas morindae]|uniref:Uncharacterized protein n=1 Tax=Sphingomonas morindae TaxID=1541170 RepID=A0ABY4XC36_9SPHN|nr:hypothetical protein [Sphingomonas morindae]USI74276.1 hypothetical protein LHA26_07445 [Sphingomonas morindae]
MPIAPMPPLDGDFGARPEAPARYGEDAARLARARALEAGRAPTEALPPGPAPVAARHRPGPSRWQGGLWVLVRPPSAVTRIAEIGELGGSEAGMRLTHPIGKGRRLAASLRVSRALAAPPQAEIAPGIDWRVRARLPVHLLVERRVPLRGGGPADWAALLVAGLHHRPLARRLWLDGYGQAGLIGTARPRGFADGAARLGRPLATRGRSEVAATLGLWGAAQPGAARIDAGPGLVLRLPLAGATMGAALDWRFRLAGRSLPGSGPALTLTLGF